jgi:acylphosphatase
MSEQSIKHLRITGIVQGVGFRWSLSSQARRLGLTGWVRNRRDGSVEALVAGRAADVAELVRWAHRGPPAASVDGVEELPVDGAEPIPQDFSELSTS